MSDSSLVLQVHTSWVRPACYCFMGVCLLLTAVLALTQPLPFADNPTLMRIMTGYVGGLAALVIIGINGAALTVRKKGILIDAQGITDTTGIMAPGALSWNAIEQVYVLKLYGEPYLCVVPKDITGWMEHLNRLQRRLAQANIDGGFAPVRIQYKKITKNVTEQDALRVIKQLHPELIGKTKKIR